MYASTCLGLAPGGTTRAACATAARHVEIHARAPLRHRGVEALALELGAAPELAERVLREDVGVALEVIVEDVEALELLLEAEALRARGCGRRDSGRSTYGQVVLGTGTSFIRDHVGAGDVDPAVDAPAEAVVHVAVDVRQLVLVEEGPHVLEDQAVRVHVDDVARGARRIGRVRELEHAAHREGEGLDVLDDVHALRLHVPDREIERKRARALADGSEHELDVLAARGREVSLERANDTFRATGASAHDVLLVPGPGPRPDLGPRASLRTSAMRSVR
jgi:hypothetical protein